MSSDSAQTLWPKWMWVAVPVLVVVVVAGLWWAIFSGDSEPETSPTTTPTSAVIAPQPTQGPTLVRTLPPVFPTATEAVELPTVAPPTASMVETPPVAPTIQGGLAVGDNATVSGTSGVLNMREGAGTEFKVIGSLREGTVVEIIGGPREADGYIWWQVRTDSGTVGWAAGEWLKKR